MSLGVKLRIEKLKNVRDWFLKNEVISFGNPVENLVRSYGLPKGFVDNKKVQENMVNYFAAFDESINDFEVEEIESEDEKEVDKSYTINTVHKKLGGDGIASIPLRQESSGTLKMSGQTHEMLYSPFGKNIIF